MKSGRYVVAAILVAGLGLSLLIPDLFRSNEPPIASGDGAASSSVSLEAASLASKPHFRSSYSPEASGDDARARIDYELMMLRDPNTGRIPANVRQRELAFAATIPRAGFAKSSQALTETWTPRGPANVGGRTRALAIDLDFNGTSNQRLLAGGISGGMYVSNNDGQSWTIATGLNDHASVTAIAQDPSNRNVWYYGTGEHLGNSARGLAANFNGIGMFKSTDGGASWSHLASTGQGDHQAFDNTFDRVWSIAIHPTSSVVYAAVYGQILASSDGGSSWSGVLGDGPPFSEITDVHVAADGDVYAALSRSGSGKTEYGIFRSSTGASGSFTNISPPGLANDPYRIVIDTAPSDPSVLYAFVQTTAGGETAADHQLFRYNEGSNSWQNLTSALPDEQGVSGNASMSTQGGYDQIVVVHPSNPNIVFIGGTNLYRSDNGGQSFTRVGGYAGPDSYAGREGHHSDQHALVFYPNNTSTALSGSDGGVSRSTNILTGSPTWAYINTGYVTSQFYGIGVDPNAGGEFIIGGLQDNGTWGAETANGQTPWFQIFSGDGGFTNVAPGGSMITVTAQLGTMYRITPPNNFSNIAPAGASQYEFIVPNALDPNDPNVLYVAESGGVWRNSNLSGIPDGNSDPTSLNWTFLSGSAQANHRTTMLSVPKAPAGRIFFATTDYQSTTRLIRVDNAPGNGSGVDIMPPIQASNFPPFPADVAANPNNGDEIVAVFSNYGIESIWHSTNAGGSWTNIGGNLGGTDGPSIRSVVIVPTNSGTVVMVGTSTGVYSTSNINGGSTSWALEGGSVIGNVVVGQLQLRYSDATVTVATHGRGVYQAKVSGGGATGAQAATDKNALAIEVLTPNVAGSTTFTLTNSGSQNLTYSVNASGSAASGVSASIGQTPRRIAIDESDSSAKEWSRAARERRINGKVVDGSSATISRTARRLNSVAPQPELAAARTQPHFPAIQSGDFLVNDDGNDAADQYVGFGDGFTPFQWFNRFTAPTGGFTLESVFINLRTEQVGNTSLFLIITDPQGNEFTSGTVNLQASPDGTWYELAFTPVQLNAGQTFDVEFIADASIGYPAGADFNGQVTGSSYFFDGFSYTALSTQANFANGAFLIRAQGSLAQTQNSPPVANIQVSKTTADVNESISFNGTGSSDSDGTITSYAWNFGDGATASSATATHAYTTAGSYTASLTVTDDKGATNTATTSLTIVSTEPSRLSATPASGTLSAGQSATITVNFDAAGLALGAYSGTVSITTNGGNITLPVTIGVTSVGTESDDVDSGGLALKPNYPNPFSLETTIPYHLERAATVRIGVFDLRGRLVRRLIESSTTSGDQTVVWDGRDDGGSEVASGTYLVRLEVIDPSGGTAGVKVRKITLRK
ncbi:MAG: PKD domain-containing protein [Bacteroidetes bacterium]|nr:PKD domain-containing protein [Bacteroidota bacterium]